MTIIAAIKDDKGICYGSDSRVSYANTAYDVCNKWHKLKGKKRPILIGNAGSSRLDNLIMSSTKNLETSVSPFEIADILKRSVIADGWKESKGDDGDPTAYDVDLILIFENQLYRIGGDFSCTHIPDLVMVASGSGETIALGCHYAVKTKSIKEQIKLCILAAIKYDINCGGRVNLGYIEL